MILEKHIFARMVDGTAPKLEIDDMELACALIAGGEQWLRTSTGDYVAAQHIVSLCHKHVLTSLGS